MISIVLAPELKTVPAYSLTSIGFKELAKCKEDGVHHYRGDDYDYEEDEHVVDDLSITTEIIICFFTICELSFVDCHHLLRYHHRNHLLCYPRLHFHFIFTFLTFCVFTSSFTDVTSHKSYCALLGLYFNFDYTFVSCSSTSFFLLSLDCILILLTRLRAFVCCSVRYHHWKDILSYPDFTLI